MSPSDQTLTTENILKAEGRFSRPSAAPRNRRDNAARRTCWPGHCEFWEKLAKLHFLDDAPISVGEVSVSPREFLRSLLEPQLQYKHGERDVAVIRVDAGGLKGGKRRRVIYQVIDRRDLRTGFTDMTRTTGYTTSIGAQMILRGDIQKRGVLTPVRYVPFEIFSDELRKRGIHVEQITGSW